MKNVKNTMCQFVPNFLIYVSDKYYLNWSIVEKVITEIRSSATAEKANI